MGQVQRDPRVIQSKRLLKCAFLSLLQTNSLNKISVRMIIDEAQVNRGTFYNHFKDKETFIDSLVQNETESMKLMYSSQQDHSIYTFYKDLLTHIGSEHVLYTGIFNSELKSYYSEESIKCLIDIHKDFFKKQYDLNEESLTIKSVIYANVIQGIIFDWASKNYNYRPEYLVKLIEKEMK